MAEYMIQGTTLTAIGDAIRSKTGSTELIMPENMPTEIENIQNSDDKYKKVLYRDDTLLEYSDEATVALTGMFYNMNIKKISMPNLLIVTNSFCEACKSLTDVDISSCTSVGTYAFRGCTNLKNIDFSSCKSLGVEAFRDCTSLTEVTIPESMTNMSANSIFFNCGNLVTLNYNAINCNVNDYAFNYNVNIRTINYGPKVTKFVLFNSTNKITFAEGFTSIPETIFNNKTKLKNIVFPSTITTIPDSAFTGCTAMEKYDFTSISLVDNSDGTKTLPITFGTNVFLNIPNNCSILFKDAETAEVAKATTNLAAYADYIHYVGETEATS